MHESGNSSRIQALAPLRDLLCGTPERFNVSSPTLHDHVTNLHASPGVNTQRNLTIFKEDALLDYQTPTLRGGRS